MSFSGFINKGSPYFAGHPNVVNIFKISTSTPVAFDAPSGQNVELDCEDTESSLPNNFSVDGGELTYNGPDGIFYISYQVSSYLLSGTSQCFFYVVVNNSLEIPSEQQCLLTTAVSCVSGGMYANLTTGDVIYVGFKNGGSNNELHVLNLSLSCCQIS